METPVSRFYLHQDLWRHTDPPAGSDPETVPRQCEGTTSHGAGTQRSTIHQGTVESSPSGVDPILRAWREQACPHNPRFLDTATTSVPDLAAVEAPAYADEASPQPRMPTGPSLGCRQSTRTLEARRHSSTDSRPEPSLLPATCSLQFKGYL